MDGTYASRRNKALSLHGGGITIRTAAIALSCDLLDGREKMVWCCIASDQQLSDLKSPMDDADATRWHKVFNIDGGGIAI